MLSNASIELCEFTKFREDFDLGKYGKQRLGQAFYNRFNLHKMSDQSTVEKLYELDGEAASNEISKLFNLH